MDALFHSIIGEEAARVWAEVPVRVDGAAVAAQCAWVWARLRAVVVVPAVRLLLAVSLAMTVMILVEKLFVCAACLVVKAFRLGPERRYRWEPIVSGAGGGAKRHPMVLVQIPMYNEREVYKLSIGAACALEWPSDRFVIQVLDDSTDPVVKDLVELECQRWKSKGVNIKYEVRGNRKGYKAGALKEGLKHDYVKDCQYIAMFDADFQPESDFLLRTIPFLVHNPEIALVQTRWKFVNADECLLTRFQEMSLDYHFKFEQEAGSSVYSFFGFNGTAGVWRIAAIDDAGGWKDRTTVEDMDLAVLLFPEIQIPLWGVVYVPTVITLLKALGTPSSFHLVILWVLFENVMSLHRIKAAVSGLLDAGGRVNEWVVTEKLGDANKTKPNTNGSDAIKVIDVKLTEPDVKLTEPLVPKLVKKRTRFWERYHCSELFVGTCVILCGCYDVLYAKKGYYIYLFLQGMAFLVVGFGYVGTIPPCTG
ncbi:hypothetical protein PR202_gb03096 [Eleusine coracana subsp. coracana]|uniref:glucomannan 4-beta-mannosyltransferase n=1 Tax=Eleusine coracana subsp. coracana TaxID=191504 RepID=A0AAV5DYR3_ELECO|nr:hypothetical protein PR202_gb03096 [Eleusine coracana subsp. coracana]